MTEFPPTDDPAVTTEPEPTEPEALEPAAQTPDNLEPEVAEPAAQTADNLEPEVAEPEALEPAAQTLENLEPEVAEPVEYTTDELLMAASEPLDIDADLDDLADPAATAGPPPPLQAPQPPLPPGPPPPGPAPTAGPPPVRRIYRSRADRKVGGVSAGIAEYFAIDPTIVRLATLAFMISGIGLLVYIAAWIIVPLRPEGAPYYRPPHSPASEKTMTLAFGLAALALAFGIVTGSWEVLALALIGGGVWLLSEHTGAAMPATATAGAPAAPTAAPASGYTQATAFADTTPHYDTPPPSTSSQFGYDTASYPPPVYAPVPPKERKPQRITWIVLSVLALLAAVGIAAATGDWWNVSATRFLGLGVIIIGIGVVVGQLRNGGARGLIPLGILAAVALFPVSAIDGLIDDGIGENVYRPLTFESLEDNYQHGIGKLTVDLTELDFSGRSDTIDIDLGIGELIVLVPDDAGGQAVLQAKAGEISHRLPNTNAFQFEEGVNIETGTVRLEGNEGTLDLNINVGLGTAELQSVPSS